MKFAAVEVPGNSFEILICGIGYACAFLRHANRDHLRASSPDVLPSRRRSGRDRRYGCAVSRSA
ncbi:hypothetical protein, partial [Methylobacterium nigriterrae]|uniref:hypothetical protein n=1 Tax=Methylobacterium nigriterrae TaxID=3127512 RepID=UPI003013927A